MKNKKRFITYLIIGLIPLLVKFSKDIYKIGIKDGKANIHAVK